MPDNNMMIMLGLGAAALWFMNRGGSQEDQVDQLAGAAMMASGEGTTPDAPFQAYSAPANPIFFFNQGGQMAQVPGTNVPMAASSDEDIGVYPGRYNKPELEFTVERSSPPPGTTDISPTTPEFAGNGDASVTASTVWDQQALIATSYDMPLIGIETMDAGFWGPVQSNVDISNLSSKESFRAVNLDTGHAFTTTGEVLSEYVRGFAGSQPGPATNALVVSQTAPANIMPIDYATGLDWI
jgi:hypothetical protein